MYESSTATVTANYWIAPCVKVVKEVRPDTIIDATCLAFKIERGILFSTCRKWNLVRARNLAMYLIRQKTNLSLLSIGKLFKRDHTTVIHAMRYVNNELSVTAYRQQMNEDLKAIMARLN